MRNDIAGMFWDDTPEPKVVKEKVKRTPPERIWESPEYLPYLDEARAFNVQLMDDADLCAAYEQKHTLIFDVEVYPNYFLCSFLDSVTGKVSFFEMHEDNRLVSLGKLAWIIQNFCIVGFNSYSYDLPIISLALQSHGCEALQWATEEIILRNERGDEVLKHLKAGRVKANHIDLIEVCPLRANLKAYGGRLHSKRMQDLPIPPGTILTEDQKLIVRWYNIASDLPTTHLIFQGLHDQLELRIKMGTEYGMDLRSRSDAQIAETIISHEVARLNGCRPKRPKIEPCTFRYRPPPFLRYQSSFLQWTFAEVCQAQFEIDIAGNIKLPETIKNLKLQIGSSWYQMGAGGLHSSEQKSIYYSDKHTTLFDCDVTSYYPSLILNSGIYPDNLGPNFLRVYQQLVSRRLQAKKTGNKAVSDSLKITINGSFGKLGSPYSILYAPHMLIQVTVTGQLSLLMLIERFELAGIPVISANTDGIDIACPNSKIETYRNILTQWEHDTKLVTEETCYRAIYRRDVNNYIAIADDGSTKAKGAYFNPWKDSRLGIFRFHKNPANLICSEAVEAFLIKGIPVAKTIEECTDVTRFVTVRSVRGGAVKDKEYLGKSIRWYYAQGEIGEIVYASNGNVVPRSKGARPLMILPSKIPLDLDYNWYILEAKSMLQDLGL